MNKLQEIQLMLDLNDQSLLILRYDYEKREFVGYINISDTFAFASADTEPLAPLHVSHLSYIVEHYDFSGVIAWVAIQRGEDPLPKYITEEYRAAEKLLVEWEREEVVIDPVLTADEELVYKDYQRLLWLNSLDETNYCKMLDSDDEGEEVSYSVATHVGSQRVSLFFGNDYLAVNGVHGKNKPPREFKNYKGAYESGGFAALVSLACKDGRRKQPEF